MDLSPREDRRDRTFRAGTRRLRQHRALHHSGAPCAGCTRTAWAFSQGKLISCGCSSHKRGSPKLSRGPCYAGVTVRPAVRERRDGRRLCFSWLQSLEVADQ